MLNAVLAGVFVLAGALVGGALTFLNNWSTQARTDRREDRLRWVRDMREVSADFIAHCHDLDEGALMLHNAFIRGQTLSDHRHEELWEQLVKAQNGMIRGASVISLIAPEEIAAQAHEVRELGGNLGRGCEDPDAEFSELQIEYSEATADFMMLVRRHLGVDPGMAQTK